MDTIDLNSVTDMVFQLKWDSGHASHMECYSAKGVNLWRDWFPERIQAAVVGQPNWSNVSVDFMPLLLQGTRKKPRAPEQFVIWRRRSPFIFRAWSKTVTKCLSPPNSKKS